MNSLVTSCFQVVMKLFTNWTFMWLATVNVILRINVAPLCVQVHLREQCVPESVTRTALLLSLR